MPCNDLPEDSGFPTTLLGKHFIVCFFGGTVSRKSFYLPEVSHAIEH